jgi:integrase
MPRNSTKSAAVLPFPIPLAKPAQRGPAKGGKVAPNLKSASARRKVALGKREFIVIGAGLGLGYRRSSSPDGAGSWQLRAKVPDAEGYAWATFGTADDVESADGVRIFSFEQALAHVLTAGTLVKEGARPASNGGAPLTVQEAVDAYAAKLTKRGGRAGREARTALNKHAAVLLHRTVRSLNTSDMEALVETVPQRVRSSLKAALNGTPSSVRPALAVTRALNGADARPDTTGDRDDQGRAIGLDEVPDEKAVRAIIAKARKHGDGFGRLVATLAATGSRPSQVVRCRLRDLEGDVLLVPPSKKGRPGKPKPWARRPMPPALAAELRGASAGRDPDQLLFWLPRSERDTTPREEGGTGWRLVGEQPWHRIAWARAAREAGIVDGLYQLRHACVCRLLLRGVPLRLIASALDTSTTMLERVYSRWIGAHGEDMLRADAGEFQV